MTPSELVELIAEADLLEEDQLAELRGQLALLFREAADLAEELIARHWLTRYQIQQVQLGSGKLLHIGGYRILSPVGEGGMGQVFKAEQRRLGRVVALKVIHHDYLANRPEAIRRFHREARAAAQLTHPNAIRIYDADQDGTRHFIVMEFVEGLDLARLVEAAGPLPLAVACDYIAQAALGLQHAHEMGLIHRDVKPSNLLVTRTAASSVRASSMIKINRLPDGGVEYSRPSVPPVDPAQLLEELRRSGVVKILDLGLARATERADGDSALTVEGNVMGTPDYIAPEQARDPHGVDGRADIYSLGCTLYYALTGRPPFPKCSALEKLLMHQCDEPLAVEAVRTNCPAVVGDVVRRMMAKQPSARLQTAMEVYEALAALARELSPLTADSLLLGTGEKAALTPILDVQPAGRPITPQLSGMGKTPAVPLALDRRSLSNLQPSDSFEGIEADPKVPGELQPPEDADWKSLDTPRPAEADTREAPALSLDLEWETGSPSTIDGPVEVAPTLNSIPELPAVRPEPIREPSVVWAKPIDEMDRAPQARPIALLQGHTGCVISLAFSHNRELLASGGVDGTLRLWRIQNNEFKQVAAMHALGGEVHSLAFSPSDRMLAYGTVTGHAWVCDLNLNQPGPTSAREMIIKGRDPWGGSSRRLSGSSGTLKKMVPAVHAVDFSPDERLVACGSGKAVHLFELSAQDAKYWLELGSHGGDVQSVRFSPDRKHLATTAKDEVLRIWDPQRYFTKLQVTMKVPEVSCLTYSHDGHRIAFSCGNGSIQVWGVLSNPPQRLGRFENTHGNVRLLQFQADGSQLLAVEDQGYSCVRDLTIGSLVDERSLPFVKAYTFAATNDGRYLATGNIDGTIAIHRVAAKRHSSIPDPTA